MKTRNESLSRLAVTTLLLVSTLTVMVDTVISPALPALHAHFTSVENVDLLARLVLTFPSIFVGLSAPVVGILIDRIGRKLFLQVSIGVYGLAGGAGYVIDSLPVLLASRALLGIGTAGIYVTATTLLTEYFTDEQQRETILGWQGAFITFGGVVFLLLGGVFASIGWRMPFLIYLVALPLVPLIAIGLYESEPEGAEQGDETPTAAPSMIESICQFLNQLPVRTLSLIYGSALVGMIVFVLVPVEIPFYLETVFDAGPIFAGFSVAVTALVAGLASTQYQRIKRRLDVIDVVALIFGFMGAGLIIVSLGGTYPEILLGLAVVGVGIGLLTPNMNAWIAADIPADIRGRVFGGLTSVSFLGQFLSPVVSEPVSEVIGLGATFGVGGIALLGFAGGCVGFRFWETHTPHSSRI